MKNPFVYGEVATGNAFADRKEELIELETGLANGDRIFLISPRRYGKTSLIKNVLDKLKRKGYLTAYVDLYRVASLEQFVQVYLKETVSALELKIEKLLRILRETLPTLRPRVEVDPQGQISVSVGLANTTKDTYPAITELLDAADKIANKRNKRFIVVFDEFQEIRTLGGYSFEKLLRAGFQNHHHMAYLFAGSKQHILADMVNNKARAFYKLGRIRFLDTIPDKEFKYFMASHFNKLGCNLSGDIAGIILEEAGRIPYYVQYFCNVLWNKCREGEKLSKSLAIDTIAHLAFSQSPLYLTIWDGLSLNQRKVMQALSKTDGKGVFSHEFTETHHLGPVATVQISIKLLIKKGLIDKDNGGYTFCDPLFKKWILKSAV